MTRWTIRRHYFFSPRTAERLSGDLKDAAGWDRLRSTETEPAFAIPSEREAWQAKCCQEEFVCRGEAIAALASEVGVTAIGSFGVGAGCVEYQIHCANPRLSLHLSDFGGETVRRLRRVFPEAASITVVDLIRDVLPQGDAMLTLLHRVDSEFTNEEFREVFTRLHAAGHRLILLVPTAFLTPRGVAIEIGRRVVGRVRRRPATYVGLLRTRSVFTTIWGDAYRVRFEGVRGDTHFILLEAESLK